MAFTFHSLPVMDCFCENVNLFSQTSKFCLNPRTKWKWKAANKHQSCVTLPEHVCLNLFIIISVTCRVHIQLVDVYCYAQINIVLATCRRYLFGIFECEKAIIRPAEYIYMAWGFNRRESSYYDTISQWTKCAQKYVRAITERAAFCQLKTVIQHHVISLVRYNST